jgi:hypothetical protein
MAANLKQSELTDPMERASNAADRLMQKGAMA